MEQRRKDERVESRVAGRLDEHYRKCGIQFERVYDYARQVRGVDLVLKGKDGTLRFNVDEKAKYRDLQKGKELDNYSFEVNRVCNDGERRLGWFADSDNETDFYCFAFPKFEDPDDIHSPIKPRMKVELFMKSEITDIVLKETTIQDLIDRSWQMVAEDQSRVAYQNFILWKTPSYRLPEAPVNLLIKKELIQATPHYKTFYA